MRGQPGSSMAPGDLPAVRRYVRGRKPPRIILCSICTVTCLLFMASAAMLAVGYLNPFGTIGLSVLAVGAVVFFGTILFLVLMCLWVERKYPGSQPLSFRIQSRRPPKPTTTTFVNSNISGRTPARHIDISTTYRIHNDLLPSTKDFKGIPEKTGRVPSAPTESVQEDHQTPNQENQHPRVSSIDSRENADIQAAILESLKDQHGNHALTPGDTPDQDVQSHKDVSAKSSASSASEGKSHTQQGQDNRDLSTDQNAVHSTENIPEKHIQSDKSTQESIVPPSSPKKERKAHHKTHHVEVPPVEPYSSPTFVHRKAKVVSFETDEYKQHGNPTSATQTKIHNPAPEGSPPRTQKSAPLHFAETHEYVRNLTEPQAADFSAAPSASPNTIKKTAAHQQDEKHGDATHRSYASEHPTAAKASLPRKSRSPQRDQHNQDISQMATSKETSSLSAASPTAVRKHVPAQQVQHNQDIAHGTPHVRIYITPSASPPTGRKAVVQHKNVSLQQPSSDLQSKDVPTAPKASPVNARKMLQLQQDQANWDTSQRDQNLREHPPAASPTHRSKSASPERDKRQSKNRRASRTQDRSAASSSTTCRMHSLSPQRDMDVSHKAQHSREYASAHSASPPDGRKDGLQHKHSHKSPDNSHRNQQSREHSTSPTASPPTGRRHGRNHQHQSPESSQSSDVPSSPASSPLNARKLLQYKKDHTHHNRSHRAMPSRDHHSSDPAASGARRVHQQQETQQHPGKPQRSPRSRETSPAAAESSPPSNKKIGPHHRKDQR